MFDRCALAPGTSGSCLQQCIAEPLLHPNMHCDPIANLALATRIPGCIGQQLDIKPLGLKKSGP